MNITIKILRQNPLRFPRKANRFRKEWTMDSPEEDVKFGYGRWRSECVGGTVPQVCNVVRGADSAKRLQSCEPYQKNAFHWQTTPSVSLYECTIRSVLYRRIAIANSCQRQWPWRRGRRRTEEASSLALPLRIQKDTGSYLRPLARISWLMVCAAVLCPPGSG
jgi:hypothetical protein